MAWPFLNGQITLLTISKRFHLTYYDIVKVENVSHRKYLKDINLSTHTGTLVIALCMRTHV